MEATATPMISRLKAIRREMGLTQQEFASRIGVSFSMIRQVERGVQNVTDRIISLLAEKCGVNEKWLRYGEGRMFVDERLDAADIKRDAFRQFVTVFELTPAKQLQLAALAEYPIDAVEVYAAADRNSEASHLTKGNSAAANETAKRNVARLLKAVQQGSVGRVDGGV